MNHYPRQLSGGQEQRVAIARAIVSDPALLLADEPTGDLDRASGAEILTLLDRYDHYPRQLSGGQEQRVAIARAVVADPTIIVADEPTGDLDAETTGQILELLVRLNEELRTTLLMVTHDAHAAERATLVRHLEKGTLKS